VEQRRRFLRALGAAGLGLPLLSGPPRRVAAQPASEPTLFLEVCLRVQQCLMHVMVPPGIAKYPNRVVGVSGEQLALFASQNELKEYPNNVFLTNDSLELAPHIDSVAMLDTGEAGIGSVHGLEAGCGMRSPGRVMDGGASGQQPMYLIDAPTYGQNGASSEQLYSSVPTPATFHNYYQKLLTPELLNGYAFKGLPLFKQSCYHFGAGLSGAELTRIKTKTELMQTFAAVYAASRAMPTALAAEIAALEEPPYLKHAGAGELALAERFGNLELLERSLELSPAEVAHWSAGVPPMRCTVGDLEVRSCLTEDEGGDSSTYAGLVQAQIWEQFAHATKLLCSGVVRSVAIESHYGELDGDGSRPEQVQREYAQQLARPLARCIAQLKAAGLYDRTVIAVYTVDGGRRPAANSYGHEGKGTLVLAGGKVRGGYYGDIVIQSDLPNGAGHTYAFRPPDPATGVLLPPISYWQDQTTRTPSGSIWRTVMKAAGIPESEYVGKFNKLVDDALPLDFMLAR
jgi:hypothetical protein